MPGTPRKSNESSRERPDGRRQLLVYLAPDVVKDLKKAAVDADRPAYEIVEEAVATWLDAHGKRSGQ